jgi:hypothetical protein
MKQPKSILYTSAARYLALVVFLQFAILLTLWGTGLSLPIAKADGIPDAGAQRDQMIEQLKATNEKLDRLVTLLSGGELQVKLSKSDEESKRP